MIKLNKFAKEVHENAKVHGWWDEEISFGDIIALCHSELSEALEEHRNRKGNIYYNCNSNSECIDACELINAECCYKGKEENCEYRNKKPEGIGVELADCIIRILDYCGKENIDIEKLLEVKHEYNKTRSYKHGGKVI